MRIHFFVLAALIGSPALANDIFPTQTGYYHDANLPAQVLCPAKGTFVSVDGQVLTRELGPQGATTTQGYQCAQGGVEITCASGEIVEGVLTVPPRSGAQTFVKLTDLGDGRLALGTLDGSGQPTVLARCPEDFPALVPGAGPEAFMAPPPPAAVDAAFLDAEVSNSAAWAASSAEPLPFSGVFGLFPRTEHAAEMQAFIANIPPETVAALAAQHGVSGEDLSPERLVELTKTQSCHTRPLAVTGSGVMLELVVERTGQGAMLRGVAACSLTGDIVTCEQGDKRGDAWLPGNGQRAVKWLLSSQPGMGPLLCNPDLGADHPNSCSELVRCDAAPLSLLVDGAQPLSEVMARFEAD